MARTKFPNTLYAVAFFAASTLAAVPAHAAVIYDAAAGATAIMGYIESNDFSLPGTSFTHPFNGTASEILDGDTTSWIDNYSGTEVSGAAGSDTAPLDFVGVLWGGVQSDIVSVRLYHQLFYDGGWFGTEAGDPNAINQFPPPNDPAHNLDDANDVAPPAVQVTTDGGTTWIDIAGVDDDYVAVIRPLVLAEARANETPVTFDFTAQSGIDGLRLVGYGGGRSDVPNGRDEQGFIGVAEFEVGRLVADVPEPATGMLAALGLLAAARLRRRRLA